MGDVTLILGDALTELAKLPAASVDAVVTDPPYGDGLHSEWDRKAGLDWLAELPRVLKPSATVVSFGSFPYMRKLLEAMEDIQFRRLWDAVYVKQTAGVRTHRHLPRYQHELIMAFCRNGIDRTSLYFDGYGTGIQGKPWVKVNESNRGTYGHAYGRSISQGGNIGHPDGARWMTSVLFGRPKNIMPVSERTTHPSQKPLEVVLPLVLAICPRGGVCLDPFMGSGTTGVACIGTGRKFIGIDRAAEYVELARERIGRAQLQPPLFTPPSNTGFHLTGELAGLQTNFDFGEASPEPPAGEP